MHTPGIVPFCKKSLCIRKLLRLFCICHVYLKRKKRNFNYGNEPYWGSRELCVPSTAHGIFISSPCALLFSELSSLPIFTKTLGSIISLVQTRIMRSVNICPAGEEGELEEITRNVNVQPDGGKLVCCTETNMVLPRRSICSSV